MTRSEKEQVVSRITELSQGAQGMYFADFSGVTVGEINDLRREFFKAGVKYAVAKNTLIARALEGTSYYDSLKPVLRGPTAVAFWYEDSITPAKILKKFSDKTNKLSVKLCVLENQVFEGKRFDAIAAMPSKNEMIASILGSLNAPIANIVYALDAIEKKLQPAS